MGEGVFQVMAGKTRDSRRTARARGARWVASCVLAAPFLVTLSSPPVMAREAERELKGRGSRGQIVFVSDRDGDEEIFVMNGDGSDVTQLTHNERDDWDPRWGPGGKRIVFARCARESCYEDIDIHVMRADGSNAHRVIHLATWDEDPAWSPNGKWIAFAADNGGGGNLVAVRPDGSGLKTLVAQQDNSTNFAPTWSPDGKRLAFLVGPYDNLAIVRSCCSGGFRHRYLERPETDTWQGAPDWSPDGHWLAYSRDDLEQSDYCDPNCDPTLMDNDLFLISPDSSEEIRVEDHASNSWLPSWSSNGWRLAFVSDRKGSPDIYSIRRYGDGLRRLTNHPGDEWDPDWVIRGRP